MAKKKKYKEESAQKKARGHGAMNLYVLSSDFRETLGVS